MRGGNIEETQFVCSSGIIGLRLLDRIARILQIDEIDALHHAAIGHVEARDNADADGHSARAAIASAVARSRRPS
jgi:hypothetical protein